jgi:Flp pilus assembly protein TadD
MSRRRASSRTSASVAERFARAAPFIVVIVTIIAFIPALSADFVAWDDDKNFIENYAWRGLGPDQLRWMWSTFHLGTWIPLSWMSLGLDYTIWGLEPSGYHLTNVALHATCAALLFLLVKRVLRDAPGEADARNIAAAFAALVFAVHPLRVESVAWITERRDVLSGCFYVGTLLAYVRAVQDERRGLYWVSVGCAVLALLAKGTAVTLPIAILLLNVWPLRRLGGDLGWTGSAARSVYAGLVPFVALAAIFTAIVFTAISPVEQLPVTGKLAAMAYSLQFYAWKTLVPIGLSPLYEMPANVELTSAPFLASAATVLIGGALAFAARKRFPRTVIALLGFAAILFPLLGVHQGGPQITADRNTYNASIAIAFIAGGALLALSRRAPRLSTAAACGLVAALSILTWRQVGVWHDSATLWSRVIAVRPDSPIGHNNMGNVLLRRGDIEGAQLQYSIAVRLRPTYAEAHANLGAALASRGEYARAITEYRQAAELRPGDPETENNWGVSLSQSGKPAEAIAHFSNAVTVNPRNAQAHVNWGNALVRLGRTAEAEAHYRDALTWQPDFTDAHLNWGVALAQQGRMAEAITRFESALALDPRNAQASEYLARARAAAGGASTPGPRSKSP